MKESTILESIRAELDAMVERRFQKPFTWQERQRWHELTRQEQLLLAARPRPA